MNQSVNQSLNQSLNQSVKKRFVMAALAVGCMVLTGCVYPGIGLNKGRLLDPTMDPAKTNIMANSLGTLPNRTYERSSIGAGGSSGGSCPTCR